jgi:hypothetical protein
MSLIRRVVAVVEGLGGASVEQVAPLLQEYTRKQVLTALHKAAFEGLLHTKGLLPKRGKGHGAGNLPSVYYPGPSPNFVARKEKVAARRAIRTRPPASVWELSHSLQIPGTWPPVAAPGRKFAPLGPWTEEGAAA